MNGSDEPFIWITILPVLDLPRWLGSWQSVETIEPGVLLKFRNPVY
jgi:hypothetical protein